MMLRFCLLIFTRSQNQSRLGVECSTLKKKVQGIDHPPDNLKPLNFQCFFELSLSIVTKYIRKGWCKEWKNHSTQGYIFKMKSFYTCTQSFLQGLSTTDVQDTQEKDKILTIFWLVRLNLSKLVNPDQALNWYTVGLLGKHTKSLQMI